MLKLAKLPDRTPVKITFMASPDLNQALHAYAKLYRDLYGQAESVSDLIPYMLETFLRSDPAFAKARRASAPSDQTGKVAAASPRRSSRGTHEPTSTAS
jgi:hypothetical protein